MLTWHFATLALAVVATATVAPPKDNCVLGLAVISASGNALLRTSSRETWLKHDVVASGKVDVKFFVATPTGKAAQTLLQQEAAYYGDIVIVDSAEGYRRITYQVMAGLQYYKDTTCQYVGKVDDDVLVRLPKLVSYLENELPAADREPALSVIGWVEPGGEPHRTGRYEVSEAEWPSAFGNYPAFAVGVLRVHTRALCQEFARQQAAGKISMFPLEDIAVAIWVDQLKNSGTAVSYVNERRCFRQRICEPRAFNVLIERGPPMFVDPNVTMHQLFAADQAGVSESKYCPEGTRMEDMRLKDRVKLHAEWEVRYKELDAAWATRHAALGKQWAAGSANDEL